MKKLTICLLVLALLLSITGSTFALGFTGELGNEATFETLQEAHASSPAVVKNIMENESKTFVGHPVLDGYPEGTTFIYRSANQYAGRAAARLNTNIFVYAEQKFETKDAAFAYLQNAGLIDIIDEAIGSIVLVTPSGETFTRGDAAHYYALQTAMLAQKASGTDADGNTVFYSDAEYFGGYGYVYFIGVDGGATFFNNYIAPEIDFVGRLAGVLLVGGSMEEIRKPATFVPVYQVNGSESVLAKYKAINGAEAMEREAGIVTYYNQAWPLRKLVDVKVETVNLAEHVKDAYYGMFIKAMRVPVLTQAIFSAGSPYSGYNFDEAPYSLFDRSIVIDGKTAEGIYLIKHQKDDTFAGIKTTKPVERNGVVVYEAGEYMDVWYEYLPEEVLNNTAPAGTVPLLLANHGGGDDVRVFVEEFGLLNLAGKERFAMVAADHQRIGEIRGPALTALVEHMLKTYPALDASRVYATGYSMGGLGTTTLGLYNPKLLAAIAPLAGSSQGDEEQLALLKECGLPYYAATSSYDRMFNGPEGPITESAVNMLTFWTAANGIELPFDLEAYPLIGFAGDKYISDIANDEFGRQTWIFNNEAGEPRVAFSCVKGMIHALYPEYGPMVWNFMKHYSRDLATGEIIYNP